MKKPHANGNVRRYDFFARLIILTFFISCLLVPEHVAAMGPRREKPGETETGLASWYGTEQGFHTASGERFDPQAMTAAHRHLPFGTIIRVVNNLNGRTVELRINDRGPYRSHRILDVSEAAADVLDMKKQGTVPITLEIVTLGKPGHHAG